MVPEGKGCLCIEYFPSGDGQLLSADDQTLFELAMNDAKARGYYPALIAQSTWS